MSEIALAKINSFAPEVEQADVPPEEPIFVLTSSQLQEIFTRAVPPLQDRVESLEAIVARQREDLRALEATELQEYKANSQDIREIFAAIDGLDKEMSHSMTEATAPKGEKTLARIAKIDEILKARGSTTLKELEHILKIRPQEMSRIVARLDKRRYEIFIRAGDERERVLRLKVQIR